MLKGAEHADRVLEDLATRGVVGLRVDVANGVGELQAPGFPRLLAQMKALGWMLQVHCIEDDLDNAAPWLDRVEVPLMIDHFARPDPKRGLDQPGFQALLRYERRGTNIVKLSGPFRAGKSAFPYVNVDPFVAAAIESFGLENCVWGSDWPFVNMGERVDFGPPLTCLKRWLPDPDDRRRVLWDNPARLFGFQA